MQVDTQAFITNVESVYSQDLANKNHEIAMLRTLNNQLQAELNQLKGSANQTTEKEG